MMTDNEKWISVVCATDSKFAMPITVMVRSLMENLSEDWNVMLFVLDGGISEENIERMKHSWNVDRLTISWIDVKHRLEIFNHLRPQGHISKATYYRFMIGYLLPDYIDKVIYLDGDIIVTGDISELWQVDMEDKHVLAVPDMWGPFMESKKHFDEYEKYSDFVHPISILNYKELGFKSDDYYFNAGMMVIDLEWWRKEDLLNKGVNYLKDYQEFIQVADQDALNVLIHGSWKVLPLCWNRMPVYMKYKTVNGELPQELSWVVSTQQAKLIHFADKRKPWQYDGKYLDDADQFFKYLDMTEWRGYRPENPFGIIRRIYGKLWGMFRKITGKA